MAPWAGGNSFNDFLENQLTKFRAVSTVGPIKANRDHAFFCSKQDFSLVTILWI